VASKIPKAGQSLADLYPELAAQADGWDPRTVSTGSGLRLKWKCDLNHSWEARPPDRIVSSGCPFCSNKRLLVGFNDLATTHPGLAEEADGWDPTTVIAGSDKKVGWKCSRGHRWTVRVVNRKIGYGCPYCNNNLLWPGFNDLATTNPDLAAEADGWDPTTVIAGSNKKVGWKCSEGHQWINTPNSRNNNGTGCPMCSGRVAIAGVNDLLTTHPDLAEEADGWDPSKYRAGSKLKFSWRCKNNHTWIATIGSRALRGTNCPICGNRKLLVGYNDLATTHPAVALQADGWDPKTLTAGSNKTLGWICNLGHTWKTKPNNRAYQNQGCPVCSGNVTLPGYNDLATTHPALALQADGWDPTTLSLGSNKKVSWKCNSGHSWKAAVANRTGNNSGCPICTNKEVLMGYNDFATTHPGLAAQADGWDPRTVVAFSQKRMQWRCSLGHTWRTRVARRSAGDNCPVCSNQVVLVGFNDLATTNPDLAAQADGWDPRTVVRFANKKVTWKCENGHQWKAVVASRSQGVGCPGCAQTGFDSTQDGWLYLILNDALNLLQVGISNVPEKRLKTHLRSGFDVVLDVRGPQDGQITRDIETAILQMLKKQGAKFASDMDVNAFSGWTESWDRKSFPVSKIRELLDFVYEDDEIQI
jgi:hypothetical protein